jgi:hypothetical protein
MKNFAQFVAIQCLKITDDLCQKILPFVAILHNNRCTLGVRTFIVEDGIKSRVALIFLAF